MRRLQASEHLVIGNLMPKCTTAMITMIIAVMLFLLLACSNEKYPSHIKAWHIGHPRNVVTKPLGGLALIGGGRDPDKAFIWFNHQTAGGDVVVLRASRSDGYNSYLYNDIGSVDSVRTILVDSREIADDAWVIEQIDQAEGIFLAGGDQSAYVTRWSNTGLSAAITRAHQRGAVIGGTSAGAMVLGGVVFSATQGSISSQSSLQNPYASAVQLSAAIFSIPILREILIDTHFTERDRMGRLFVFIARALQGNLGKSILGLGIDESTAILITASGELSVVGNGGVTALWSQDLAECCQPEQPLTFTKVQSWKVIPNQAPFSLGSIANERGTAVFVERGQIVLQGGDG
ncbi:MAG: cyanophycinase [Phycisphaerales bacterium]|nr:cyanophycinase [Phycisphaerales bacterium]